MIGSALNARRRRVTCNKQTTGELDGTRRHGGARAGPWGIHCRVRPAGRGARSCSRASWHDEQRVSRKEGYTNTRLACYAIPRCLGPSHPNTKARIYLAVAYLSIHTGLSPYSTLHSPCACYACYREPPTGERTEGSCIGCIVYSDV